MQQKEPMRKSDGVSLFAAFINCGRGMRAMESDWNPNWAVEAIKLEREGNGRKRFELMYCCVCMLIN